MSVITKDKVMQVRLEQDLYERVAAVADHHRMSVSSLVRGYLLHQVNAFERKVVSDGQWAATKASRSAAVRAAEIDPRQGDLISPVVPPVALLSEKRASEKAAKERLKKKREEKWST